LLDPCRADLAGTGCGVRPVLVDEKNLQGIEPANITMPHAKPIWVSKLFLLVWAMSGDRVMGVQGDRVLCDPKSHAFRLEKGGGGSGHLVLGVQRVFLYPCGLAHELTAVCTSG